MRQMGIFTIGLLFLFLMCLPDAVQARHKEFDDIKKLDTNIRRLISAVDSRRISRHLFYLAKDPLPYRKLNLTLPGHNLLQFRSYACFIRTIRLSLPHGIQNHT